MVQIISKNPKPIMRKKNHVSMNKAAYELRSRKPPGVLSRVGRQRSQLISNTIALAEDVRDFNVKIRGTC